MPGAGFEPASAPAGRAGACSRVGRDPLRVGVAGCAAKRVRVAHRCGHAARGRHARSRRSAWSLRCGCAPSPPRSACPGGPAGQRIRVRLIAGLAAPDGDPARGRGADRPARVHPGVRRRATTLLLPRDDRVLTGQPPCGDPRGARRRPRDASRAAPPAGGMPGRRRRRHATRARSATSGCCAGTADREHRLLPPPERPLAPCAPCGDRRSTWSLAPGRARSRRTCVSAAPTRARAPTFDLTLRLSQVEVNAEVPAEAFTVRVPAKAAPITLDELRQSGPLRDRSSS